MITIGIVGAGLRGRLFAEALADQPDVTVVGFAEPSRAAAERAVDATGLPVVPDTDALLTDLDPDAVIVATPDFAHRDPAVAVASAGKSMLLEKPVATTLADAYAIRDAVRAGGGGCLVGFENRWSPHVVAAHETVSSGAVGNPVTAAATLSNSYSVPQTMLSWAERSSPAWFLMPHTVDLLSWLVDAPVASVTAVGSRGLLAARGIDTWDVVHALLTFAGGVTATLSSAWVLPDAGEGVVDFTFSVVGTEGSVRADLTHQGLSVVTDRTRSPWPVGGRVGRGPIGAPVWMARDFAAGLVAGEVVGPGIDHGVAVTEVICAIERSLASGGRPESVPRPG